MTYAESEKIRLLYELYEQPMFRIALAVLKDPGFAEDAVSDAFMHLIKRIDRIDKPGSPSAKAYVVKTIKSSAIDIYRKNRRFYERFQPIDDEVVQIPDPGSDIERIVGDGEVEEVLNSLSDTDRRIFVLRCASQLSWKEVADRLSMTETAVRKRFERARRQLIKQQGGNEHEKIQASGQQ